MTPTVAVVVGLAVLVVVLIAYAWLAVRTRGRHLGHSFMAPFEDMWDPASHRAEIVIESQVEQGARLPGDASGPGGPARPSRIR